MKDEKIENGTERENQKQINEDLHSRASGLGHGWSLLALDDIPEGRTEQEQGGLGARLGLPALVLSALPVYRPAPVGTTHGPIQKLSNASPHLSASGFRVQFRFLFSHPSFRQPRQRAR